MGRSYHRAVHGMASSVFLALLLVLWPSTSAAQQREFTETATLETYSRVLDLLFPTVRSSKGPFEYRFDLRFLPSSTEGESQIIIETKSDGSVDVTHYSLPRGAASVSWQVHSLKAKLGREDASEIAKCIKIESRKVDAFPSFIRDFIMDFAQLDLKAPMQTSVAIDSWTYMLTFRTNSNELRFSLSGSGPGEDQRNHALIRWMNRVKKYVEEAEPKK